MTTIKLKKGLNIKISGDAEAKVAGKVISQEVGIVPDYFEGMTPKVAVREGDEVKVGSPILFDKNHPEVKVVSPVCGTIKQVARGERRKLLYVLIEQNGKTEQAELPAMELKAGKESVHAAMLAAGFGAMLRQRPYDVVANPKVAPKAIFVSAFDSAPFSADCNLLFSISCNIG